MGAEHPPYQYSATWAFARWVSRPTARRNRVGAVENAVSAAGRETRRAKLRCTAKPRRGGGLQPRVERRGRTAARRGTRGKRMREKSPSSFFPFFAPPALIAAEWGGAKDFRSELLRMLRAHGVEFDERYVFD